MLVCLVGGSLLSAYSLCLCVRQGAHGIFKDMKQCIGVTPDLITYNAMISACEKVLLISLFIQEIVKQVWC